VGYSNDFQTRSRLSKYDEVRKPLEYQHTSAKCVFRELPWAVSNSVDGAVKLIQETFLPPAHCAADTNRWLLQLRPKRKGEFERIRCSLLLSRPEAAARFFPRNQLNGPAVDLLKTPVDLLSPSFFPGGVDGLIQAAN
jgi:hypothetical protein